MSEMGDSGSAVESAESTTETGSGSAGGEAVPEAGQGEPAIPPASDGYYIGGPEVEADIAKQEQQTGTEVANSGGSGDAGATNGAKAGGDSEASGGGKAGAGQDASGESTTETSRGSAGGETAAEPGEGEPAGPPAGDGYYIGGPELEKDIAKMQEPQAAGGGGDNGSGNGPKRPPEPPTTLDQPDQAQDFGTRVQNGLETRLNDPNTRDQFPHGYDPFHGDTPEQYLDKYASGVDANGRPNWNWPYSPGGTVEGTESPTQLQPGLILDRYGPDQGKFLCLSGTSYPERSLPAGRLADEYNQYRVVRPLPANRAEIAPAFGEPGGGIQYRTDQSVRQLIVDGYLEEVRL
jgi:Tuberculosis necrotizing toxin